MEKTTKKITLKPEFKNISVSIIEVDGTVKSVSSAQMARNPNKYIQLGYGAYFDMPVEEAAQTAREYFENVISVHRSNNPEALAAGLKLKESEAEWNDEKAALQNQIKEANEKALNALKRIAELEKGAGNTNAKTPAKTPAKAPIAKAEEQKTNKAEDANGGGSEDLPWNGEGDKPK